MDDDGHKNYIAKYGPEDDPEKYEIDLWDAFDIHIGKGEIDPSGVVVNVSSHYPGYPYVKVDRTTMPHGYPCMGSASLIVEKSGDIAVMSIANFRHYEDGYHQTWLWWRNFDGSYGYENNVPGHQIESSNDVVLKIEADIPTIQVTLPKFKKGMP